jgi:hypothetical protein
MNLSEEARIEKEAYNEASRYLANIIPEEQLERAKQERNLRNIKSRYQYIREKIRGILGDSNGNSVMSKIINRKAGSANLTNSNLNKILSNKLPQLLNENRNRLKPLLRNLIRSTNQVSQIKSIPTRRNSPAGSGAGASSNAAAAAGASSNAAAAAAAPSNENRYGYQPPEGEW